MKPEQKQAISGAKAGKPRYRSSPKMQQVPCSPATLGEMMTDVRRLLDSNDFDRAAALLRQMQDSRLNKESAKSSELAQRLSMETTQKTQQEEERQSQMRVLSSTLQKAETERTVLNDQTNLLRTENGELRSILSQSERQREQQRLQYQLEADGMRKDFERLQQDYNKMAQQLRAVSQEAAALKGELSAQNAHAHRFRLSFEQETQKCSDLENLIRHLRDEMAGQSQRLHAQELQIEELDISRAECNALQQQLRAAGFETNQLGQRVQHLEQQLLQKGQTASALQEEKLRLQAAAEQARAEHAELRSQLERLVSSYQDAEAARAEEARNQEALQNQLALAQQITSEVQEQNKQLLIRVQDLQKQLKDARLAAFGVTSQSGQRQAAGPMQFSYKPDSFSLGMHPPPRGLRDAESAWENLQVYITSPQPDRGELLSRAHALRSFYTNLLKSGKGRGLSEEAGALLDDIQKDSTALSQQIKELRSLAQNNSLAFGELLGDAASKTQEFVSLIITQSKAQASESAMAIQEQLAYLLDKIPADSSAEKFLEFFSKPRRPVIDNFSSTTEIQNYRLQVVKNLKDRRALTKDFGQQIQQAMGTLQGFFVSPQLQKDFKIPVTLNKDLGRHFIRYYFNRAMEQYIEQWIRANLGELQKSFPTLSDKNKDLFVLLCLIVVLLLIDDFELAPNQQSQPGKLTIFPTFQKGSVTLTPLTLPEDELPQPSSTQ